MGPGRFSLAAVVHHSSSQGYGPAPQVEIHVRGGECFPKPGILRGRQTKSSVPHADNKSLDPNVTKRVGAKESFMFATFEYGYASHR